MHPRIYPVMTAALALFAATSTVAAQDNLDLWKEFQDARKANTVPTLPDFSWAGYHYSEKTLPKIKGPIFDVTKFGAKPNDDVYDDDAVQLAIDAAQKKGGGVVFFPKGRFKFCPKENSDKRIRVTGSNIVLRGSGSGDGGTELFIDKHNLKNGSCYFEIVGPGRGDALATITKDAQRETFEVTVNSGSKLKPGQTVCITYGGMGFKKAYFGKLRVLNEWSRGISIHELHTIERVSGSRVRFREPLHLTIVPQKDSPFQIRSMEYIEEVGVEDIRFVGNWNDKNRATWLNGKPRPFVHHRKGDPLDDYGWEALRMRAVRNSWVRDCEFRDLNSGLYMDSCAAFTVLGFSMTGKKGHTSIHARRGYGVLVKDSADTAGTHHGIGLGYSAAGTVYLRYKMAPGQNIDCHSGTPYATLFDAVQGGHLDGSGGPTAGYPNHGKYLVVWNFEQRGGPTWYDFWRLSGRRRNSHMIAQPILVGHHGVKVSVKNALYNLSPGKKVEPASLFEAQLKLRLGDTKYRQASSGIFSSCTENEKDG